MKCKHCGGDHKSEEHAKHTKSPMKAMGKKAEEHKAGEKGARVEMRRRAMHRSEERADEKRGTPKTAGRGMAMAKKAESLPKAKGGGELATMPAAKRERMGEMNAKPVPGSPGHPKAPGGSITKVIHEHHHYHHKAGSHMMAPPMKPGL